MSRLLPLPIEELTDRQRSIRQRIADARSGHFAGPFPIWLRIPALADAANELGNVLRRNGTLDRKLFGILVLVVAQAHQSQFEWSAHAIQARDAGLSEQVIEAIRIGRRPDFSSQNEEIVFDLADQLARTRRLDDETYARALAHLGETLLIEAISAIGFYSMVALVLNGFDVTPMGEVNPFERQEA